MPKTALILWTNPDLVFKLNHSLSRTDSEGGEEEVGAGDGEDDAGHQARPGQDRGQPRDCEIEETILGQSPGSCSVKLSKSLVFLAHY